MHPGRRRCLASHRPRRRPGARLPHRATHHGHCSALTISGPTPNTGTATSPDQRWTLTARLLHDETLDPTDRAAGCLLLLYGQQLSRIATTTTNQVTTRDSTVHVRLGEHDIPVPEPLGKVLTELARNGRAYTGTGSPTQTDWLFPADCPENPSPQADSVNASAPWASVLKPDAAQP
ncbi:hypothetical protein [Mycobacterium riyadhense]|uniref:hypothetical protein n=1 Tax=Mycobacterium riyadhense TaxID=486698 RepID=UPI00195BB0F9|nr:hypothetical protein [Mycobacterium riyadhense]